MQCQITIPQKELQIFKHQQDVRKYKTNRKAKEQEKT